MAKFVLNNSQNKRHKVLSLFTGGGGLDLGFAVAGFSIAYSTDIDPFSCSTLVRNQGKRGWYGKHPVEVKDVAKISKTSLEKTTGLNISDFDFIIGGPPCQSFSVFGRRSGLNDPRGNLIWEYARIVNLVRPKGFLFENVAGLKTIHNGEIFANLLDVFTFGGLYKVNAHTYQIAEHGVPQFRQRVIIVGNRLGEEVPPLAKTHGVSSLTERFLPYRTVKEALSGLPKPDTKNGLNSHVGRVHSERIIARYRNLRFGERDPKTRINKLNPDNPSYTIIVGSDHGGGKGHVHPYSSREVTPRESARIQTFPDWWEFSGTGRHVIRQVGNAVPPLFAAQLATHVNYHVFGAKPKVNYQALIKRLELQYLA